MIEFNEKDKASEDQQADQKALQVLSDPPEINQRAVNHGVSQVSEDSNKAALDLNESQNEKLADIDLPQMLSNQEGKQDEEDCVKEQIFSKLQAADSAFVTRQRENPKSSDYQGKVLSMNTQSLSQNNDYTKMKTSMPILEREYQEEQAFCLERFQKVVNFDS